MAPSAQPPEGKSPPACIAALDEIERRWREALSLVHAGEPTRAEREVEKASVLFTRLGGLEQLRATIDPARLADFAERMTRLSALHHELAAQSRRAQAEIVKVLESTRNGRAALRAYGSGGQLRHACDEVG
jgi:uncharacterized protein involved in exopolysaccharide biosynthesis